ncbi:DUF3592 domain-containing protein [Streptomyces sp. NK08204]|uniref:DUF3592 domain-containing protein n=1 Tax=Streptomyces sp. NK08204 TaxID=2873260 RepID=UPI001CEDD64A|nr:DUF3592 domain-containing protein [Streptomyces sp. NK08204]
MELLIDIVPVVMTGFLAFAAYRLIQRARRISRTWTHGLTAEGRCLRSYTTTSGGGGDTSVHTTLHHVYEFRTREGRTVRFDEENGRSTVVEGDHVTVRYLPECPELATALAPSRGRLAFGTGFGLAVIGLAGAVCVAFIAVTHTMFTAADSMMP